MYTPETSVPRRKVFASILQDLVKSSRTLYGSISDVPVDDDSDQTPLVEFKDGLLEVFSLGMVSTNEYSPLRLSCLLGLFEMIMSRDLLSESEVGPLPENDLTRVQSSQAVQHLHQSMLNDADERNQEYARKALLDLAWKSPSLVIENSVVPLLESLEEGAYLKSQIINQSSSSERYRSIGL